VTIPASKTLNTAYGTFEVGAIDTAATKAFIEFTAEGSRAATGYLGLADQPGLLELAKVLVNIIEPEALVENQPKPEARAEVALPFKIGDRVKVTQFPEYDVWHGAYGILTGRSYAGWDIRPDGDSPTYDTVVYETAIEHAPLPAKTPTSTVTITVVPSLDEAALADVVTQIETAVAEASKPKPQPTTAQGDVKVGDTVCYVGTETGDLIGKTGTITRIEDAGYRLGRWASTTGELVGGAYTRNLIRI
jgi:hypothetical protein